MSKKKHKKKLKEVKPGSFIYQLDNAIPKKLCKKIIKRFEADTENQYQGAVGPTSIVDLNYKRSTDLSISFCENWKDIDEEIFKYMSKAIDLLKIKVPYFNRIPLVDNGYLMHRTQPGEFYKWHVEADSYNYSERQMVAIVYLNDVAPPGGETEFKYQNISVSPKRGTMVFFPPFWTHEHRGVEVKTGTKYTFVSWLSFDKEPGFYAHERNEKL